MSRIFLFSIDLEDPREHLDKKERYEDRVEENTRKILEYLNSKNIKITFFTVGLIAERFPELIKTISKNGHEIACHSYSHTPLPKLGPLKFEQDLVKNIEAITRCGLNQPKGYRAPTFSLTKECFWAYDILAKYGIEYSSSILPAKSPLYGIPGFHQQPQKIGSITEYPITIGKFGPLNIPIAGGVYFRVFPKWWLIKKARQQKKSELPLVSYLHPYDIDSKQEYYKHEHMNTHFMNMLMYLNRRNTLSRVDSIIEQGYQIMSYDAYRRYSIQKGK
jgi:polysaccharide deacetylase family protein (PEP-CTERM system associated)